MNKRTLTALAAACVLGGGLFATDAVKSASKEDSKECKECAGGKCSAGDKHEGWMLKKFDANGDGKLDEQEKAKMDAAQKEHEAKFLAQYDANKDGKLDDAERAIMKKDMTAKHAEFIKKHDTNGDGKLDDTERAAAKADRAKSHPKD